MELTVFALYRKLVNFFKSLKISRVYIDNFVSSNSDLYISQLLLQIRNKVTLWRNWKVIENGIKTGLRAIRGISFKTTDMKN